MRINMRKPDGNWRLSADLLTVATERYRPGGIAILGNLGYFCLINDLVIWVSGQHF